MVSVSAGCAFGLAMTGRPEWTESDLNPRLPPCEGGDLPLIYRPSIAPHIGGAQIDFACGPKGITRAPGRAAPRSVESDVAWPTGQSFKSIGHVRWRGDMSLRLFNTRTRRKDLFVPRMPGVVKMYVCGPTTYDYSHLGHARSYIAFDTARRYLESLGLRVAYVQNFTDIEEVIIQRAAQAGSRRSSFSAFFIDAFLEAIGAVNVLPATHYPKVTQHIPAIVALLRRLIDRGYAYAVDGEVYFRTRKAKHSFGILSHRTVEDI